MRKIELQKIVGSLFDMLRKLYINGTVIQKFLAFLKLQKIVGNFCFSEQIFYRKELLGVPDEVLTTGSMTSLYCRRLHQALIRLFKCLSGTGPTYIGNLFKYRHTPYGLRGAEGLNLELPNFNLKFKKNSFIYLLTKLWNSLPSQVRL